MIVKNLGNVTAYADAVAAGYTGTREQFAQEIANAATYAGEAHASETAAAGSAEDAEAYAVGKRGGVDVEDTDPTYHNNAKYYATSAAGDASDAKDYRDAALQAKNAANADAGYASADALVAEGYSSGTQAGDPVESGSPYYHNNAKYYAEQAETSAGNASTSEINAGLSETAASGSASAAAADALKAEGYAIGKQNGADVASGSPYYHNSAKYYKEQAAASATASAAMTGLAPAFSASTAYAAGDYVIYSGTLYKFNVAHAAGAWTGSDASAVTLAPDVTQLKSDLTNVNNTLAEITGKVVPPSFVFGSRYVNNGADTFASNNVRITFALGQYITLRQGDTVTISSSVIYTFSGGYSTDNGATFTSIVNRLDALTIPADGIYFFTLTKRNDAVFTDDDLALASTYITFTATSADSMEGRLQTVEQTSDTLSSTVNDIKEALDCEVAPIPPAIYLAFPNTDKGLNYLGELTDDSEQDTTDYIEIAGLYDIFRIVTTETKYSLGALCYYTETKQFIRRDLLGAEYNFSIFNGKKGVWLNVDKTTANAKYIRYSGDNTRGFKYWEVRYGTKANALDDLAEKPFLSKKIVNFGDSIIGQTRPPKDVSTYLANKTGATVYNCGFGGCEMSVHADSNYNPFSMCNLADAIATNTWTTQEAAAAIAGMPAYFAETVTLLKSIDFSEVDIATIAYGTNDWNNSSPLDNGGNADMTYFADALRHSIETLLTAYPNLRLFICTPIYRFWMNEQGQFTEDSNTKVNPTTNTKLTDFVTKTEEVAAEYQLPCINNYNIGMNRYDRSAYFYPTDGTHPKPEGNKLIAEHIASELF